MKFTKFTIPAKQSCSRLLSSHLNLIDLHKKLMSNFSFYSAEYIYFLYNQQLLVMYLFTAMITSANIYKSLFTCVHVFLLVVLMLLQVTIFCLSMYKCLFKKSNKYYACYSMYMYMYVIAYCVSVRIVSLIICHNHC